MINYLTLAQARMSIPHGWSINTDNNKKVAITSPLGSIEFCKVLKRDGFEVVSKAAFEKAVS